MTGLNESMSRSDFHISSCRMKSSHHPERGVPSVTLCSFPTKLKAVHLYKKFKREAERYKILIKLSLQEEKKNNKRLKGSCPCQSRPLCQLSWLACQIDDLFISQ